MSKNWTYKRVDRCRLCGSSEIKTVMNFGETALANSYLSSEDLLKYELTVPLECFICRCGSFQLGHTVNPEILFSNYLYESSTSASFRSHFEEYAKDIESFLSDKDDYVIDVGSNDGILLKPLKKLGYKILGIEPAKNLADKCNKEKIPTINKFLDSESVSGALKFMGKKAKAISCNNCFAHIDDLHSVVDNVKALLEDDGVFIFEVTYLLRNIINNYFDMQYHEHIFTHSVKPLKNFFELKEMNLFRVKEVGTHGGSIRCYVKKNCARQKTESSVQDLINAEENLEIYNYNAFRVWNSRIAEFKEKLNNKIIYHLNKREEIWAYGCPAKLTTLFKVMGLNGNVIKAVVDDSPLKQGKFTPDTRIPIVSKEDFKKTNPKVCLISAWNFAPQIKESNKWYKGTWIHPFE